MSASPESTSRAVSRRTLFAGAGTVGALAAVASVLPTAPQEQVAEVPAQPKPERGGGYTLSEHVKHYYRTARI